MKTVRSLSDFEQATPAITGFRGVAGIERGSPCRVIKSRPAVAYKDLSGVVRTEQFDDDFAADAEFLNGVRPEVPEYDIEEKRGGPYP